MLKILQVTDTHLGHPGELIFGSDAQLRLEAAVDDINRNHADATVCIFTGDLVNNSDPMTYRSLRRTIDKIAVPYRILPGNHDERQALRSTFPEIAASDDGFLQSSIDTEVGHLFLLDTLDPHSHGGMYCAARQNWLTGALDRAKGRPVFIFMHHPPFHIELPHLDQYVLTDGKAFGDLLSGATVRHIFFGHVHRTMAGSWRGIPFSALPSTNHQGLLDFQAGGPNTCTLEQPAYAVILIDAERTLVHFHDFLYTGPKYAFDPHAPDGRQVTDIGPGSVR